MKQIEFENFFENYSKNVDNAQKVHFWKLSDSIIREIIKKNIPRNSSGMIMDAGGGTGRWICELGQIYKSNFVLYDLSEDMLTKAKENIANAKISDRVQIIRGNLTDMNVIETESIDYIISIYSPISFVSAKELAVKELYRTLKKGGKLLIMGHGYFNAIFSKINNYLASPEELRKMEKEYLVKWGVDVPELNVFSKESMEALLKSIGFQIETTYGIPIFVQPGPEDFDPQNEKISRISSALQDPDFFDEILELEMKYNSLPTVVNRGVNILIIGIK